MSIEHPPALRLIQAFMRAHGRPPTFGEFTDMLPKDRERPIANALGAAFGTAHPHGRRRNAR